MHSQGDVYCTAILNPLLAVLHTTLPDSPTATAHIICNLSPPPRNPRALAHAIDQITMVEGARALGGLPPWVVNWLLISGVCSLYDAAFVLLRPSTLPGGRLHTLFLPYEYYARMDKLYSWEAKLSGDGLCEAQSWLNVVEVAAQFAAVALNAAGDRFSAMCILLVFGGQVATAWKTVMYLATATACGGFANTRQNGPLDAAVLAALLYTWVAVPALVVWVLGKRLLAALNSAHLPKRE